MGKIVYKCVVDPDYLTTPDGLLGTRKLPKSFQEGVRAKKLNEQAAEDKLRKFFLKKFPAVKKQMSFNIFRKAKPTEGYKVQAKPCWFLDAVDKLDGKIVKVTNCKEAAYDPVGVSKELERVVCISCEFTKYSEVSYFLNNTAKSGFDLVGGTIAQVVNKINDQLLPQKNKLKERCLTDLKADDKVKVKINYTLKY